MSALDKFLQHARPGNFLCESLSIQENPVCNCGRDAAASELSALRARIEELEGEQREMDKFHPRAMKLLRKRKNFVVVADDEPYFAKTYLTIRAYELHRGAWTGEDEAACKNALAAFRERAEGALG